MKNINNSKQGIEYNVEKINDLEVLKKGSTLIKSIELFGQNLKKREREREKK
jgi:hypothetical protein